MMMFTFPTSYAVLSWPLLVCVAKPEHHLTPHLTAALQVLSGNGIKSIFYCDTLNVLLYSFHITELM